MEIDYGELIKGRYKSFMAGYNSAIKKACEWIFGYIRSNDMKMVSAYDVERDFREAMEGISGNEKEIPSNSCNSDKNLQELTWQDVKRIVEIADEIVMYWASGRGDEEAYYTEVLKRFNESKED